MLKGLGQLGDMAKIMKQAQEMQSRMSDAQAGSTRSRWWARPAPGSSR